MKRKNFNIKEKEMKEELTKERSAFIAKLLQRLCNEDWGKWLGEEKQAIDSSRNTSGEAAEACREQFYAHLLKKIEDEIKFLKQQ